MKLKKVTSMFLALLVVVTMVPTAAITAQAANSNLTPAATKSSDEKVTLNKSAKQTALDEWEVTLRISGGGTEIINNPIDIVLVMDTSGSMRDEIGYRAKDKIAKDAAKALIDDLYAREINANIGVVKFNNLASIPTNGLTPLFNYDAQGNIQSNNKETLSSVISGLNAEYDTGTNMQQGLAKAYSLLENSPNKKYVILLSDGVPTYYNEGYYVRDLEIGIIIRLVVLALKKIKMLTNVKPKQHPQPTV